MHDDTLLFTELKLVKISYKQWNNNKFRIYSSDINRGIKIESKLKWLISSSLEKTCHTFIQCTNSYLGEVKIERIFKIIYVNILI